MVLRIYLYPKNIEIFDFYLFFINRTYTYIPFKRIQTLTKKKFQILPTRFFHRNPKSTMNIFSGVYGIHFYYV